MFQNSSAFFFPKARAHPRGRPSPYWDLRVIWSKSAIRLRIAWQGFRDLSENFIVVQGFGTIRRDSCRLSSSYWPREDSMCCFQFTSKDFCLPVCNNGSEQVSASRCLVLRVTAPRTACLLYTSDAADEEDSVD